MIRKLLLSTAFATLATVSMAADLSSRRWLIPLLQVSTTDSVLIMDGRLAYDGRSRGADGSSTIAYSISERLFGRKQLRGVPRSAALA